MLSTNSKNKRAEQLTRLKIHIRNDGDDDDMTFMGSPPLLPLDDPAEYKKSATNAGHSGAYVVRCKASM
jgi:hypothetical protein